MTGRQVFSSSEALHLEYSHSRLDCRQAFGMEMTLPRVEDLLQEFCGVPMILFLPVATFSTASSRFRCCNGCG